MVDTRRWTSMDGLHAEGFQGFVTVADLRLQGRGTIPARPGVYLILRDGPSPPDFLVSATILFQDHDAGGSNMGEVVALLDAIAKASVGFVAVKENIRFEARQDIQTKVMTTLFAEVERGPDLRTNPRRPRESQVVREKSRGGQRDRWASRASTAGRTRSVTSSSRERRRVRSRRSRASTPPDTLQLHRHARAESRPLECIST